MVQLYCTEKHTVNWEETYVLHVTVSLLKQKKACYSWFALLFPDDDPTYESGMFEPVSIRELADDAESLRGEFTYAPVYPYFNSGHQP